MSWDRVECPICGRQVAVHPTTGRMVDHYSDRPDWQWSTAWCAGICKTPDEARVSLIPLGDLILRIRLDLVAGSAGWQALTDLETKLAGVEV